MYNKQEISTSVTRNRKRTSRTRRGSFATQETENVYAVPDKRGRDELCALLPLSTAALRVYIPIDSSTLKRECHNNIPITLSLSVEDRPQGYHQSSRISSIGPRGYHQSRTLFCAPLSPSSTSSSLPLPHVRAVPVPAEYSGSAGPADATLLCAAYAVAAITAIVAASGMAWPTAAPLLSSAIDGSA